jgi:pimeloyl-ACP methyl ester carboxylesterase
MHDYRQLSRAHRAFGGFAAVIFVLLGVNLYLSRQAIFEEHLLGLFGAPTYLPVTCWFENEGAREIDCGYLYVLEDRTDPESAIIRLPVAIVRGSDASQAPALLLAGGPGASVFITERLSGVALDGQVEVAEWSENRDLIFIDIRGVGLSRPSLRCPNVSQITYWESGFDRWIGEVKMCGDNLERRGVELSRYNSMAVVQDLVELQDEVGIERWVLFGESYGTRPAMLFMRDYPERVEAAVLAGVFPPWVGRGEDVYRHVDRVIDTLENACEADEDCAEKYPSLKSALLSAMQAARQEPQHLHATSSLPTGRISADARIDDSEIIHWLAFQLSRRGGVKIAPKLIHAISKGHYPSLSHLVADWPLFEEPYFTQGAYTSIMCNDVPELQTELLYEQAQSLPYLANMIQREIDHEICDVWPHAADFALSSRPADYAAEVPALILTGDFDMPTPKERAEETERVLPRSIVFDVRGSGHNYVEYSCAQGAIEAFLKDPGRTPEVPCTQNENRLVFH